MAQSSAAPSTLDDIARDQIRHWIGSTGITQVDLAARIGRNQAWLSRYLAGEFDTDLETLERMAGVFDHTLTTLLGLPKTDPEETEILRLYRGLTSPLRKTVRVLLDELNRGQRKSRVRPLSRTRS